MKNNSNRSRKKATTLNGRQIYERIKFLADKEKISIKALAIKAGFKSPNTIYNYKYGQNPNQLSLEAIARTLYTTPEFLKGETDEWKKPLRNSLVHQGTPEWMSNKFASDIVKDTNDKEEEHIADLNSPVFALNGQKITGELAKDIRDYAEFKLNQAKKDD